LRASLRGLLASANYSTREGWLAFRRNGLMSAAAVTTILVALLALGASVLLAMNLSLLAARVEEQLVAVVYVKDGMSPDRIETLRRAIVETPGVASAAFVSREQALRRLQESLGDQVDLRDVVRTNPLPDTFEVRATRAAGLADLAAALRETPGVRDVTYGADVTDRVVTASRVVRGIGAGATGVLAGVALVVILNTLRLTIASRRGEIEIMRLVGATNAFIRWPFLVEGALQGVLAAVAALLILGIGYGFVLGRVLDAWPVLPAVPAYAALPVLAVALVAGGAAVGLVGSLLAIARFLRAQG
jgi:cell division transport system permease protein